ncbi:MAG: hypothetical protein WCY09_10360 [Candidatus Omnitrophota bacterium]|jgi:hypothetical protein
MQQLTEKGDKVIVGLWVMILMVGMTVLVIGCTDIQTTDNAQVEQPEPVVSSAVSTPIATTDTTVSPTQTTIEPIVTASPPQPQTTTTTKYLGLSTNPYEAKGDYSVEFVHCLQGVGELEYCMNVANRSGVMTAESMKQVYCRINSCGGD